MNTASEVEPLADPLLAFATFVRRLNLVLLLSSVAVFVVALVLLYSEVTAAVFAMIWSLAYAIFCFPVVCVYTSFFPKRSTDVLYLRAFNEDATTAPVRIAIAEALGHTVRVAGIRDPRRRASAFDYLAGIFFLRYANPVHMNLETGVDWRQRLWRTLGQISVVVIDVRNLTSAVIEEIKLSSRCVGLRRIAFVVDNTKAESEWKADLGRHMKTGISDEHVNLICWRGADGRTEFVQQTQTIFQQAPDSPANLDPSTLPSSTDPLGGKPTPMHGKRFWVTALLVPTIAVTLAFILKRVNPLTGSVVLYSFAIFVNLAFFVYLFDLSRYLTKRQLRVGVTKVTGVACWTGFLLWSMIAIKTTAGAAVHRRLSVHNLMLMGVAARDHDISRRALPVSGPRHAGDAHRHSWQTKLLPYMGGMGSEYLYKQIDMQQAWDGEVNRRHFKTLVPDFVLRVDGRAITDNEGFALSHYAGNDLIFGRKEPISIDEISDGKSYTFIIGEAEGNWVAWGNPDNMRHPSVGIKRGPQSFGHQGSHLAIMGFADGSVRVLPEDMDPRVFEALGTPTGGEEIDDPNVDP